MDNEVFNKKTVNKFSDKKGKLPESIEVEIVDGDEQLYKYGINPRDDQFLTNFEECYYGKKKESDEYPKGIKSTPKEVEDTIDDILYKKDNWEILDVFNILAWKTGKINLEKSSRDNIEVAKSWDKNLFIIQLPYHVQEKEKFYPFAEEVIKIRENYKKDKKVEDVWNSLINYLIKNDFKNDIKGLGTVYLVTLLSFITKGDMPIFDRFAMAALTSFYFSDNGINIPYNSVISGCMLPSKKDNLNRVLNLVSDSNSIYNKYIDLLNRYYSDKWKKDRKYDRALWVYGHFFTVP